jgi:methionyl-tRNA formyltransferase
MKNGIEELRFVYAGNRSGVLKEMLKLGLNVTHVLPVENSWLAREIGSMGLSWSVVGSKRQAIHELGTLSFDVFVSCGFPFILPITKLKEDQPNSLFINIHPSLLPDLRGADPIPGAILFRRDSGVSCHLMDDGIDTGPVISQLRIPYHESMDARLLYYLCFQLEPSVFTLALERTFKPLSIQPKCLDPLYYSFRDEDLRCSEADSDEQLLSRIRAFSTPRKGALFTVDGAEIRVFRAEMLPEPVLQQLPWSGAKNVIVAAFEDSVIVNRQGFCRLSGLVGAEPSTLLGKRIFS